MSATTSAALDVLCLGFAVIDHLALVPRLPGPDEIYAAQAVDVQGGGPAATAAVTLARLGARAAYVGTLGDDSGGEFALAEFRRFGVDVSGVVQVAGARSVNSVILVQPPYRSILYDLGDVPELQPAQIDPAQIRAARILHLDGHYQAAAMRAARLAREAGVLVSLDGGAGELWLGLEELLWLVDILVVARWFAQQYTGEDEVEKAGSKLLAYGARIVGITDGLRGSWVWTADDHFHQPAYVVDVVDTTGAGDVYHGAFLYALLQGWPLRRVAAFASATAALKCCRLGGRAGIPTSDQVEEFLQAQNVSA